MLIDSIEKAKKINELNTWIKRCEIDEKREQKIIDQLKKDIALLRSEDLSTPSRRNISRLQVERSVHSGQRSDTRSGPRTWEKVNPA